MKTFGTLYPCPVLLMDQQKLWQVTWTDGQRDKVKCFAHGYLANEAARNLVKTGARNVSVRLISH